MQFHNPLCNTMSNVFSNQYKYGRYLTEFQYLYDNSTVKDLLNSAS